MKSILDQDKIMRTIKRISYEIIEKNRDLKDLILMGIVTRGTVIARRIQANILDVEGVEIPVFDLNISSYRDDLKNTKTNIEKELPDVNVDGKIIILVDDVIYTGRTARAALDAIVDLGRPKKVQLVSLVDRGHRELPIRADYIGKNIPTSQSETVSVKLREIDDEEAVIILKK
ncbi:MAG: bifunctional pyr operon transcriptional regulator/uracil phosphoribosyltransferase PyrR [Tissierellia bacterium]|nr:bifunctional pyr operon transcriptional regulator/uracil phosphoribosyltransferase PyrR [Tissierellia bacterium]